GLGIARGNTDFVTPHSATFAAGSSTATVTIVPKADNVVEGLEIVRLTVVGPVSSQTAYLPHPTTSQRQAEIGLDDDPPLVSVASATSLIAIDEWQSEDFILKRTGGNISQSLTVKLGVTADGQNPLATSDDFSISVVDGADVPASGDVVFAPGQSEIRLRIQGTTDTIEEAAEGGIVSLVPGGYVIDPQLGGLPFLIADVKKEAVELQQVTIGDVLVQWNGDNPQNKDIANPWSTIFKVDLTQKKNETVVLGSGSVQDMPVAGALFANKLRVKGVDSKTAVQYVRTTVTSYDAAGKELDSFKQFIIEGFFIKDGISTKIDIQSNLSPFATADVAKIVKVVEITTSIGKYKQGNDLLEADATSGYKRFAEGTDSLGAVEAANIKKDESVREFTDKITIVTTTNKVALTYPALKIDVNK
ncbi:MAG: hypothetical protein ACRC7O_16995, partial [Fimbriiglobus sp.]